MNNVKCPAIGQRYRHFKQMDHFRICCRSRNTAVREILYDEIVGEPKSRIVQKHTFFAPERYTAGNLYTDSLNSA